MTRLIMPVAVAAMGVAGALAQERTLRPKPGTLQHVSITTSTDATPVKRGATAKLWVDVTPKPDVHVYATALHGFTPVALVLTPDPAVSAAAPVFPPPAFAPTLGVTGKVGIYRRTFRIVQPVTIDSRAPQKEIVVAAALNYQACDERVCYPATSVPVLWTVNVR